MFYSIVLVSVESGDQYREIPALLTSFVSITSVLTLNLL